MSAPVEASNIGEMTFTSSIKNVELKKLLNDYQLAKSF